MVAKIFVLLLVLLILGSGIALAFQINPIQGFKLNFALPNLSEIFPPFSPSPYSKDTEIVLPTLIPGITKPALTPTKAPKSQTKQKPAIPQAQPTQIPQTPCYRFKITHPDGSTSNLCYSRDDYNELSSLSYQLSSAQSFYQFHLDGVADYQKRYEETGATIYLDAKASQEQKAEEEKQQIEKIKNEMYNIKKRGY